MGADPRHIVQSVSKFLPALDREKTGTESPRPRSVPGHIIENERALPPLGLKGQTKGLQHEDHVFSVHDEPINPTRHTFPLSSPSPPPISMLCRSRIYRRTLASSTPSGTLTVISIGERYASGTKGSRPRSASPSQKSREIARCRSSRFSSPSSLTMLKRLVKRVHHADRRGVVVKPFGSPVLGDHRDVQVPALHFALSPRQALFGPGAKRDGA